MSETVRAAIVSKEELFNNIRFIEFSHMDVCGNQGKSSSFDLILADYDFRTVWTIDRHFTVQNNCNVFTWKRITMPKPNKKIVGNFTAEVSSWNARSCTFDSASLPYSCKLNLLHTTKSGYIKIVIQVFMEDERSSIIETYLNFLETKNPSDVIFTIDNEEIPANKEILALHSDVFGKMFESDMTEKKTNRAEIIDIEPEVFKMLLRFIYCGKLDCYKTDELLKLMLAANKYAVESLVSFCGYRISNDLKVDNVVDVLIVADRLKANFLKDTCMDFIIKRKSEIMKTEGYENLVKSHANLLSEIFCRLSLDNN